MSYSLEELRLIEVCVSLFVEGRGIYDDRQKKQAPELLKKLQAEIFTLERPESPYRKTTALAIVPTAEPRSGVLAALADEASRGASSLAERELLSSAAARLHLSLVKRCEQLQQQVDAVRDVIKIHEENARLKLELEHKGAEDAAETAAMWKSRALSLESELNVEREKTKQLSAALRQERIQRQAYEATQQPVIDAASGDFVERAPHHHPLRHLTDGDDPE